MYLLLEKEIGISTTDLCQGISQYPAIKDKTFM
jgi:hypothetical protein